MKELKTNAMRILDSLNIKYEILTYEVDEDNLDALHIAKSININPELIYKTIVMISNENNIYVFVTPSEFNISLKKARMLTGEKEIELLKLDKLQKYTGYIRGGCSPLGMIKHYPTFIESLSLLEDEIYVSGGKRGIQIKLKPQDLALAAKAKFAEFT